jgi:hypothetical protein
MGELISMSRKGDVKLSWNRDNEQEVTAAREIFDEKIKEGWAAFAEKKFGGKGDKVKTFDPDAERIVLVPPIAGG